MVANILFGGFHVTDATRWRARRYELASGFATAVFRGDLMTLVTAGTVDLVTAGGSPLILGAVRDVSFVRNGKREYDTMVPAGTTYTPTTRGSRNSTYVWVYDDPSTEYWASVSSNSGTNTAALIYAAIGSNMDIIAGAGSTVYRQSGHTLDGNPIAATAQMRVLEVRRQPANAIDGTANFQIRCSINEGFHPYFSAAGI
jgi:hypothetical protein